LRRCVRPIYGHLCFCCGSYFATKTWQRVDRRSTPIRLLFDSTATIRRPTLRCLRGN